MVVGAAVLMGRGILRIGRAVAITIIGRRPMRISAPPIAGRIVAGTRRTIDNRATRIVVGRPTPIIMVDTAEAVEIDTILEYCGFTDQAQRADIAADGFESYDDVNTLTEKDIGSLAKGFAESN
jgi:hypothetical protein